MKTMKLKRAMLVLTLLVMTLTAVTGGTIAWFTDSVESSANVISAGNLDVELYHQSKTVQNSTKVDKDTKLFTLPTLWEPGAVTWENLTVENAGNLHMYYTLAINVANENYVTDTNYGLSSALKVAVVEEAISPDAKREEVLAKATNGTALTTTKLTGTLAPNTNNTKTYGVIIYWEPSADDNNWNVNNGKTVTEFKNAPATALQIELGVKLEATQLDAEVDSFGPDYDEDAKFVVRTAADLQEALNNGGKAVLADDIDLTETLNVPAGKAVTIDLNGKKLTAPADEYAIMNEDGGSLTLDDSGNGSVTGVVYTGENSNTIVNGGTYNAVEGEKYVFLNSSGELTLNSGTINGGTSYPVYSYNENNKLVINDVTVNATFGCVNSYGMGGVAEINGGEFNMTGVEGKTSHIAYFSNVDATINGGEFNKTGNISMSATGGGGICVINGANLTITDGSFAGDYADIYDWSGTNADGRANKIEIMGGTFKVKPSYIAKDCELTQNTDGTWTVSCDSELVTSADDLSAALASGKDIKLINDIDYTNGISIPEGISFDGNGKTITYTGTEYDYQLVKLNTDAELKNVILENYRVRTENETNGTVTMENVVINMDNDLTGLDISRGAGTAKLTNVKCAGITDATHLNPQTQVQVDYTPYGDVLLGTKWGLEATDCEFGSLHGWNTTNNSNVRLNNTTYTVFRMHYWSNRVLYVNGEETAWANSGAIPVAHDVGGCWSVQPAFK